VVPTLIWGMWLKIKELKGSVVERGQENPCSIRKSITAYAAASFKMGEQTKTLKKTVDRNKSTTNSDVNRMLRFETNYPQLNSPKFLIEAKIQLRFFITKLLTSV
jgi:hypothetical protein